MAELVINWAMGKRHGDFFFREELPDMFCLYEGATGERNPIALSMKEGDVSYVVESLEAIGYAVWF